MPTFCDVSSIECYQNNQEEKMITFDFVSDYSNVYDFYVYIELYKHDDEQDRRYVNNIKVMGKKRASTRLNISENIKYLLIKIMCNERVVVNNAKFNLYRQDDCLLSKDIRSCNAVYLTKFEKDKVNDVYIDLSLSGPLFDKYLNSNSLNLNDLTLYSKYSFSSNNIYLISEKKIDGYEIFFNEKYVFPLTVKEETNDYYSFKLLNNYYVDLKNFNFGEQFQTDKIETDKLILPFYDEYREYQFEIIINSFININISFKVYTNGNLFGECKSSKFCLKRTKI